MLSMRELSRVYRTDTVETTALDGIDLDIADGEFVAIMGPSGCGKSTLLNVIGMLDSPSSGSYVFNGQEVAGLPEASSPTSARRISASSSRASTWSTSCPSARMSSSPCSTTTCPPPSAAAGSTR
jgi:ABC-type glutathione transport system ATPase component